MSQYNEMKRTRLRLNFMDSPTFMNETGSSFSPMTNLALNLSDTNLSATPRRRLSLSSNEDTPQSHHVRSLQSDLSDVHMGSPFTERLLRNVIKFPGSPAQQASPLGAAPACAGATRARGPVRRSSMSTALQGAAPHPRSAAHASDKENYTAAAGGGRGPAMASDEAPFLSPSKSVSPARFISPLRLRQPLEDHYPNSQYSGYGLVFTERDDKSGFRFMEPVGMAPQRQLPEQSPCKEISTGSSHSRSSGYESPPFFHSLSSGSGTESVDDGFVEFLEGEKSNEETIFPVGMGNLLSCPLKEQNTVKKETTLFEVKPKQSFRRSLSLVQSSTRVQRYSLNVRDESGSLTDSVRVFKRPDPPSENSSCLKRPKINPLQPISEDTSTSQGAVTDNTPVRLQRSFSVSEVTIKRALQRSSQDPDLIGDFSKPFILPLMQGHHQDLKTISSDTLAKLITGQYDDAVESYTIIDCRYPYEFTGGHIQGARNIYTPDHISKEFIEVNMPKRVSTYKRNILIFHCEFSSERGPKLSRHLRNSDRVLNKEAYPALHYPEVYLLHGGYKAFFERHSELCEPCSYLPMLHPDHHADLRHFRAKTKSADSKTRLVMRSSLKRLGL